MKIGRKVSKTRCRPSKGRRCIPDVVLKNDSRAKEGSSLTLKLDYLLSPQEKERASSLTQVRLVTPFPLEDRG